MIAEKTIASNGTPDLQFLSSRPTLSHDAQAHHDEWAYLADDRPMFALPQGMGGSLLLFQRIQRSTIKARAKSMGYEHEALLDFVEIVRAIDAIEWAADFMRKAKQLADAVKNNTPPKR